MHRRRLEAAAVAVLTVVVVALAAATLGATTSQGTGGTGGGDTVGTGPGGGSLSMDAPTVDREPLPVLAVLAAVLVVVLVVGAVRSPLETLVEVARSLGMAAVVVAALWLLFALVGAAPLSRGARAVGGLGLGSPGGAAGSTNGVVSAPTPDRLVVVLAALFGLALAAVAVRDRLADPSGDGGGDEETLAAIGRSAGRAADRLADADADLDNEVYRAWREMTDHLEVDNPGARTPGEFRAAALSAGMARRDVETLTDLFEDVRYGGAAPTDDREASAAASLRRIEGRYAGGEGEA